MRVRTCLQTGTAEAHSPEEDTWLLDKLKFIGFGNRTASIVAKLQQMHGSSAADAWYIDADGKTSDTAPGVNKLVLQSKEGQDQCGLSPEQVARLVGEGASDMHGKGNINTGDGGLAFVVASAGSIPGGPEEVLSLAKTLRQAGFFTAIVITTPFGFEGPKKMQSAASLISNLYSAAHLVATIEQDALTDVSTNAGGTPMTVAEATQIADNALQHTVKCIISVVRAPEALKCSKGALIWHGSEMRRFRRLLSPPLQHLLNEPNRAVLGRGVAAMPRDLHESMGPCQALMHLASDAVRAAAESPFLENALRQANRALCSVSLPPSIENLKGKAGGRAAARLAVQAAAGTLMQMCSCDEIVMCYTTSQRQYDTRVATPGGMGDKVSIEVSLLLLQPGTQGQLRNSKKAVYRPVSRDALPSSPQEGNQERSIKTNRLPATAWGALSAIAGGGKSIGPTDNNVNEMPSPAQISAEKGPTQQAGSASRSVKEMIMVGAKASEKENDVPSLGDQLADTLIAQSLDLPPKAAKWRQNQRAKTEKPRLMVQAPEAAWQAQGEAEEGLTSTLRSLLGGPQQEYSVRERTHAILERDRGDAWEHGEDD